MIVTRTTSIKRKRKTNTQHPKWSKVVRCEIIPLAKRLTDWSLIVSGTKKIKENSVRIPVTQYLDNLHQNPWLKGKESPTPTKRMAGIIWGWQTQRAMDRTKFLLKHRIGADLVNWETKRLGRQRLKLRGEAMFSHWDHATLGGRRTNATPRIAMVIIQGAWLIAQMPSYLSSGCKHAQNYNLHEYTP